MLIKRLLTAVILIPLAVITTLKLDSSEFVIAMMPVLLISSWEYSGLIKIKHWATKALYVSALMAAAYYLNQTSFLLMPILVITLLWWVVNSFWIISFPRHTRYWHNYLAIRLVNGFFFFVPLLVALSALHQIDSTLVLLLLVLICLQIVAPISLVVQLEKTNSFQMQVLEKPLKGLQVGRCSLLAQCSSTSILVLKTLLLNSIFSMVFYLWLLLLPQFLAIYLRVFTNALQVLKIVVFCFQDMVACLTE